MADMLYVGPLYEAGVEHATVHTPRPTSPPDPLGILAANPPSAAWREAGGGDNVNDWKALSPSSKHESGR